MPHPDYHFIRHRPVGLGPWPAQDVVFQVLTPQSQGWPCCHQPSCFSPPPACHVALPTSWGQAALVLSRVSPVWGGAGQTDSGGRAAE